MEEEVLSNNDKLGIEINICFNLYGVLIQVYGISLKSRQR